MSRLLVDGQPNDEVSALDRGLAYGDGVFRTLAVSGGVPEFWPDHMAKLAADCAALAIPAPDAAVLAADARKLLAGEDRCVLKFIVTRGAGGRGYKPPEPPAPTRIALTAPWPDYSAGLAEQGVAVRLCETRLAVQPKLAGIKHLNRLEQVLARAEWADPAIHEGLMLDNEARVVEGVMSNLFLVRGGRLFTPAIVQCGVAGVTRGVVLDLARAAGFAPKIVDIWIDELGEAEELFLTNSLVGIWPVRTCAGRDLAVGPVTRRLAVAFAAARAASRGGFPA